MVDVVAGELYPGVVGGGELVAVCRVKAWGGVVVIARVRVRVGHSWREQIEVLLKYSQ